MYGLGLDNEPNGQQRSDPTEKIKWIHYCETRGQKRHDPNMHEAQFLAEFFKVSRGAQLSKDVTDKITMVQRVKDLQRRNPDGKQKWIDWCDARGFGKHDPNVYDAATIQQFFDDYERNELGLAGASAPQPMQSMDGWNAYLMNQAQQAQQQAQQEASETPQYLLDQANAQLMQMGGMDAGALSMMSQEQQSLQPTIPGLGAGGLAAAQWQPQASGFGAPLAPTAQVPGLDPAVAAALHSLGLPPQLPPSASLGPQV
ncbi:unnamed protein product [Prorocentrum cordatum]|uniref:Uncharacterized protein n=1 Tax=Prorocentrum cordatum TaxID=2364126 RepID=A0ABN9R3B7_9DINO|nr:unnamed protein product [Polarella glacialis]